MVLPGASHIRMLLAAAILGTPSSPLLASPGEVEAECLEWRRTLPGHVTGPGGHVTGHEAGEGGRRMGVLLCGDLNSEPDTGTIELLCKGRLLRTRSAMSSTDVGYAATRVGGDHVEWAAHGGSVPTYPMVLRTR
eukprot:2813835-Rhodomonas_salina.3